jgi:Protein of unknown function (DUF3486)
MPKPRPKTGEPRQVRQPLKIDLLPQSAREAIETLYDRGRTWMEISEQSAQPYSEKWAQDGGGFIHWESLDLKVLEQFPDMKLPKSSLHRWFDLRVAQARKQVLAESAQAREFAAAWAGKSLPESNAAVINALRDLVFGLMQDSGAGDKMKLLGGLQDLTLAMSRMQRVELQAKRVEVDQRRIALLEEQQRTAREGLDQATRTAAKKGTGQFSLEDINLLRERTFGLPPLVISHD